MGDRMTCQVNIKISPSGKEFIKRFITNRRIAKIDDEDIAFWKVLEILDKYFKNNNDSYLEAIKIRWSNKNV